MWVEQDDENELEVKHENEEVLPSVFDATQAEDGFATMTSEGEGSGARGSVASHSKRQASTSLFATRRKAPREMGYIERLAAGLLQEDSEAMDALTREVADAALSSDQDRVAQLEYDLDAASDALDARNEEIAQLKSELNDLQMQMALRRSIGDD